MTELFDLIAVSLQLASGATLLYGAIHALEIDVAIERALRARPLREAITPA